MTAAPVNDPVEAFDKRVSRAGGRMRDSVYGRRPRHDLLGGLLLSYLEGMREYLALPHDLLGETYVDYVHNLDINACAFEENSVEFIAIWGGQIPLVYDLFYALCTIAELPARLTEHPDPDSSNLAGLSTRRHFLMEPLHGVPELSAHEEEPWGFILDRFSGRGEDRMWTHVPSSLARFTVAETLASNAENFLFQHEVGHLGRAHLDLIGLKSRPLIGELRELARSIKELLFPMRIDPKLVEMDADGWAAGASLTRWLRMFPSHADRSQLYYSWAWSLTAMFSALAEREHQPGQAAGSTHPSAAARLLGCISLLTAESSRHGTDWDAEIFDNSGEILLAARDAIADLRQLTAAAPDVGLLMFCRPQEGSSEEEAADLLRRWRNDSFQSKLFDAWRSRYERLGRGPYPFE